MFEEDTGVFFVDADSVFNGLRRAGFVDEVEVHIVDGAFAVAAEGEGVGHVAAAVLAEVEGMFALVRVFGVAVWDDHFGEGEAVEDGADFAFSFVEVGDVVQDDAFAVVEPNVD